MGKAGQRAGAFIADPLGILGVRSSQEARFAEKEEQRQREYEQEQLRQLGGAIPGDRSRAREEYYRRKLKAHQSVVGSGNVPDEIKDALRREAQERYPDSEVPEEEVTEDMLLGDSETAESAREYEDEFRGIYDQGGMDAITRAENAQARREYNQQARAQRQAALQNMYSRGMGGSGAQMAAQLQSGQSAADASYQARLGNLAEGRQRALHSLQQAGRYGAVAGGAADAFNQANTQYQRNVQQRNVGREYDERWKRYGAEERRTGMELGHNPFGGDGNQRSDELREQAAAERQQGAAGVLSLVGKLASDERAKENVHPASSRQIEESLEAGRRAGMEEVGESGGGEEKPTSSLLDAIRPATYEYKPEHRAEGGEGEQFGVMAQDLERSRLGRTMVEDGEDGVKRVDVRKAALANLAATSDLHERLKRLEGRGNG